MLHSALNQGLNFANYAHTSPTYFCESSSVISMTSEEEISMTSEEEISMMEELILSLVLSIAYHINANDIDNRKKQSSKNNLSQPFCKSKNI